MEWLVIIVTLAVLWVASLFKIVHHSLSPSNLNDDGVFRKRNVLLVIAHPDDESMFFTPALNYLSSRGCNLHILCMSTGNADGMGNVRKEELYLASFKLKVPWKQVKILDHPDLQDGFGKSWNSKLLSNIIKEEIVSCAIDLVLTFDDYGVSGHCNHRDVHQGVRQQLQDNSHREVVSLYADNSCKIIHIEKLRLGSLLAQTYCASIVDLLTYGFPFYLPSSI